MKALSKRSIALCCFVLLSSSWCVTQNIALKKFLSDDGLFSFRYPADWSVHEQSAFFGLMSNDGAEKIALQLFTLEREKSPSDYARIIISGLRSANPGMRASIVSADVLRADFDTTFPHGFVMDAGTGTVLRENKYVACLYYSIEARRFSRERAHALIALISSSFHIGQDSEDSPALLLGKWRDLEPSAAYGGGDVFIFLPNRMYSHKNLSLGSGISGISTESGDYLTQGNLLTLRQNSEDWQGVGAGQRPDFQNQANYNITTYRWYFEDAQTLVLIETGHATRTRLGNFK